MARTRRSWLIRIFSGLGLLVVVAYTGVIGYYIHIEPRIVYVPSSAVFPPGPGEDLAYEKTVIASADQVQLSAWIIPAKESSPDWVIFFHGNGGNVSRARAWYATLHQLGVNVLAPDYRGYGESTGTPSEAGLYRDARAAYDYLVQNRNVPPEQIVLYGHSLGAEVATQLASTVPVRGLVVEGGLPSLPARGQELFPFLPVSWIAANRFDAGHAIARVTCPKLFLHAGSDTVVPLHHGRTLFSMAPEPKEWVELRGNHYTAIRVDNAAVAQALDHFFVALWKDRARPPAASRSTAGPKAIKDPPREPGLPARCLI